MRMRKKPNMPQRLSRCADVQITDAEGYRSQWSDMFPDYRQLHLEIGCGKGRFTVETAKTAPEMLLVAVERVPEALVMAMERTIQEDVPNIRFISADAVILPELFAGGEVGRIYLNFCDPWPNNGHKKRRLTHGNFLKIYMSILRDDGEIHFKTDNDDLFEYSLKQFHENGFDVYEVTRDLHQNGPVGVMTDYEQKFFEQGVSINRCVAKLQSGKMTQEEGG